MAQISEIYLSLLLGRTTATKRIKKQKNLSSRRSSASFALFRILISLLDIPRTGTKLHKSLGAAQFGNDEVIAGICQHGEEAFQDSNQIFVASFGVQHPKSCKN
jgi:hypothetical protein